MSGPGGSAIGTYPVPHRLRMWCPVGTRVGSVRGGVRAFELTLRSIVESAAPVRV